MKCPNCENEKTIKVGLASWHVVNIHPLNSEDKIKTNSTNEAPVFCELCCECGAVYNFHIEKQKIAKFKNRNEIQ